MIKTLKKGVVLNRKAIMCQKGEKVYGKKRFQNAFVSGDGEGV